MSKRSASKLPMQPADLLAGLAKGATRIVAKSDTRPVIVLSDPQEIQAVGDMIRLGILQAAVKKPAEAYKKSASMLLFRAWVDRYWASKSLPKNPSIVIKKPGSIIDDMTMNFQVRFRADGLQAPDLSELSDGTTIEDVLIDSLTGEDVGLSDQHATSFVNPDTGEIIVDQAIDLVDSFNALLSSEDELKKSAAVKMMTYLQSRGKGGRITVDAITPDEWAACISIRQVVRLREGFLERAFKYCDNAEQLCNLILFVKTTLVVSDFEFADADKQSERIDRFQNTVKEFLGKK